MTPSATFSIGFVVGALALTSFFHWFAYEWRPTKIGVVTGAFAVIGVAGAVWGNW